MTSLTALERARLKITGEHGDLVVADGQLTIIKRAPAASRITVGVDRLRGTVLVARRAGGRGWLHVNAVGGSPTPAGELVAMTDPYAVRITGRTAGAAKRLARLVHDHLRARGMPSEPDQATEPADGRYSTAVMVTDVVPDDGGRSEEQRRTRQLEQLSELHTTGALTDEEFRRLRQRVADGCHERGNGRHDPRDGHPGPRDARSAGEDDLGVPEGHSGRNIEGWRRSAEPRR